MVIGRPPITLSCYSSRLADRVLGLIQIMVGAAGRNSISRQRPDAPRRRAAMGQKTMTDRKMTMGVIIGNRDFFPALLASRAGRHLSRARRKGYNSVVLTPEDTQYGLVETFRTRAGARRSSRPTAPHRRRDGEPAQLRRRARRGQHAAHRGLDVPVLVQAIPEADKMPIIPPRQLLRQDFRLQQPVAIRHPVFADQAAHRGLIAGICRRPGEFAATCRIVKGLKNLRVGLGARPAAFNTVRFSEKLMEATASRRNPSTFRKSSAASAS